jgi:hypothetical protein
MVRGVRTPLPGVTLATIPAVLAAGRGGLGSGDAPWLKYRWHSAVARYPSPGIWPSGSIARLRVLTICLGRNCGKHGTCGTRLSYLTRPFNNQYASLECFNPTRDRFYPISNIYINVAGLSYRETDVTMVPLRSKRKGPASKRHQAK